MRLKVFLASYLLLSCLDKANQTAADDALTGKSKGGAQLSALSVEAAEQFVQSWCGGVLTNLRKLDADEYLVSAEMPSWLNVEKAHQQGKALDDTQASLISTLREAPSLNAMLPTGKMILADFSSGENCVNTLVAIDTLAAAYLKKLKDRASANALSCERKSKNGFHNLIIKAPSVEALASGEMARSMLDGDDPDNCAGTRAYVLVGHGSSGTLTLSHVYNGDLREKEPGLFDFILTSFILEADGSAQFLRADGAAKLIVNDFRSLADKVK